MKRLFIACVLLIGFVFYAIPVNCAQTVNLIWSANTETDLAGYRIYLLNQANSSDQKLLKEVAAPTTTASVSVDISGTGTYVLVATAFDAAKNESAFSSPAVDSNNVVATFKDNTPPGAPKLLKIN